MRSKLKAALLYRTEPYGFDDDAGGNCRPPPEEEYPEPAAYEDEEEPIPEVKPQLETEEEPPVSEKPAETPTAVSVSWREIAAQAAPKLPKVISTQLDNDKSVRGMLEGPMLHIEVMPGFLYARFNKQEVLACFSEAASRLTGREIRAALSELSDQPTQPQSKRSLDDLSEFKEVRYI